MLCQSGESPFDMCNSIFYFINKLVKLIYIFEQLILRILSQLTQYFALFRLIQILSNPIYLCLMITHIFKQLLNQYIF